jgi:hypothetical protein
MLRLAKKFMRACNRMTCLGFLGCPSRSILGFVLSAVVAFSADAQIQQAWVAHYNNGVTNGTNQAVKMALDSNGNIYVTGFSQNTNNNLGYVTIKYAPNGTQLWVARYDSTDYPDAATAAMAIDNSNNVVVTGSALTVKYDPNGNQLWTAPYAGSALAADTNGNVGITGFGTSFNTAKLDPFGTNLWLETTPTSCGTIVGQAIVSDGNFYVAGSYPFSCEQNGSELLIIKYAADGTLLWKVTYQNAGEPWQVEGLALDSAGNAYLVGNLVGGFSEGYIALMYNAAGTFAWAVLANNNGYSLAHGLVIDQDRCVRMTGQIPTSFDPDPVFSYGTIKLATNGSTLWTTPYPTIATATSAANAIAVDQSNNSYVTGYSPGTNSGNDIVTIKYGNNGNQIWVQRYNGPGNGNDAGNAIAVDNNGNVYVTGYETLPGGGTGIVTIKYIPLSLQRRSDGTVLLEVQGSPGESFDIQASADLRTWLDLGTVLADTNGLMQFDDTNAPNFPARFYVPKPQ